MNSNNGVDLKPVKHLLDYVIFECSHLKILPSGRFYPGENPRFLNKPPLALVLRIVTNEICIVLIEKKKEISIPLDQICRFAINEKRDVELELKREFMKIFFEYPLGELDSRIQIAIDPLEGFLDEIATIIFSPCSYVEDERYLKLSDEMRRLRFNKPKGSSKKQILNQPQEQSNKLQHNKSLENDQINVHRCSKSFNYGNEHNQYFNQEPQPNIGELGKPFEKGCPSKFVVVAQNVVKESYANVTKEGQSRNASIAEWINKTNTENIMDLPKSHTTNPKVEITTQLENKVNNLRITPVVNEVPNNSLLDMDEREIMNLANNKYVNENSISVPKPINHNENFAERHEDTYSESLDSLFATESQLYITCAFLIRSYAIVIPYETSLEDLINTIEQRYNVKVNHNNFYFKNAVDDRISIVDEKDWLVARFEAKEAMNNKLVLCFSQC